MEEMEIRDSVMVMLAIKLHPQLGCVSVSTIVCIYYNYTFLPSQNVTTCYLPIAGDLEGI